jgi:hypothetical protein
MKKLIFCFLSSLLFAACTNHTKQVNDETQSTVEIQEDKEETLSNRNPVVSDLTTSQLKKLNDVFPPKTVESIVSYLNQWATVHTDAEFARVYHDGKKLFETLKSSRLHPDSDCSEAVEAMRNAFGLRIFDAEHKEIQELRQRNKDDESIQFNCSDPDQNCNFGG